jgi:hypothetical protein
MISAGAETDRDGAVALCLEPVEIMGPRDKPEDGGVL